MQEAIDAVVERAFQEFPALSAEERAALVCVARGNTIEEVIEYLHTTEDSFRLLKTDARIILGLGTERELLVTAVAYGLIEGLDFKFPGDVDSLSPQQAELISLSGRGRTYPQIGDDLSISKSSVVNQRTMVQDRLLITSLDQLRAFEVWYVMRDKADEYWQKYNHHLVEVSR